MARCLDAPPARSAATPAAAPTATSQYRSWMPRPRGEPSNRSLPPAACAWAEWWVQTDKCPGWIKLKSLWLDSVFVCVCVRPHVYDLAIWGHCLTQKQKRRGKRGHLFASLIHFLLRRKWAGRSWTLRAKVKIKRLRGRSLGKPSLDTVPSLKGEFFLTE